MLGLVLAMGVAGIMLGLGNESVQELHEILSYVTVGVVVAHILGVASHDTPPREHHREHDPWQEGRRSNGLDHVGPSHHRVRLFAHRRGVGLRLGPQL